MKQFKVSESVEALKIYDCFHLFIENDKDENNVELYSHSQADNDILRFKHGAMWTLPTSLFDDPNFWLNFSNWKNWTANDWWQYAVCVGYMSITI